jgi:hypothetical protein
MPWRGFWNTDGHTVRLSHDFLRSVIKSDSLFGSGDHRGVGILVGGAELLVV